MHRFVSHLFRCFCRTLFRSASLSVLSGSISEAPIFVSAAQESFPPKAYDRVRQEHHFQKWGLAGASLSFRRGNTPVSQWGFCWEGEPLGESMMGFGQEPRPPTETIVNPRFTDFPTCRFAECYNFDGDSRCVNRFWNFFGQTLSSVKK